MKSLSLFPLLFFCSSVAMAVRPGSIRESQSMLDVLSLMSEVAAEGPSLSYFGWSEDPRPFPGEATCGTASRADATSYLKELIEEMDWMSQDQAQAINKKLAEASADFGEILETDDLWMCRWRLSENRSLTEYVTFRNRCSGYAVTFMEGYED